MIINLIHERVRQEDCNGGVIFDNLDCELWKDTATIIDIIHQALQDEWIQIILISPGVVQNEDGLDVVPNHKYIIRKNKVEEVEEKKHEVKEHHHDKDKKSKRAEKKTEA